LIQPLEHFEAGPAVVIGTVLGAGFVGAGGRCAVTLQYFEPVAVGMVHDLCLDVFPGALSCPGKVFLP
jgi:hypothetical protein